jgi:murein DD-endopeptidase MepM/ murein hydrolase activator NlpD
VATQNTVGPSDGGNSNIGGIDFEGLGLEKEMVKGLKDAVSLVEKLLKAMKETEKSSAAFAKNLQNKTNSKIGLGDMGAVWKGMGTGQRLFTIGTGVAAAGQVAMSMAPNTMTAVTQRLAADTVAGISGMSANQLIGQANRAVGNGVTGPGGPTMAAMGIMYGGGYTASSLSSKNIMSQVAGLSAITGGSNQQVAMALSQANGMNFLRAGISIRNPNGQLKPPSDMINSAYNFLYRGRKITAEQASMVYNPGSKGYYTLSQLAGGNQELMGILQAGVVARAKGGGNPLNAKTLGDAQKSLDLMGVGKDSPYRANFKFQTSENRVLQNTQQGLVGGYNAGLGGATALNNAFASVAGAAQGVTNALMGLKGFLQTFPQAGNVSGTLSGLTSTAAGLGINALGTKFALNKVLGSGAAAEGVAAKIEQATLMSRLGNFSKLGKFGKAVPVLGSLLSAYGGYKDRKANNGKFNWGSVGRSAAIAGATTAAFSAWAGPFDPLLAGGAAILAGGANILGQLFGGGGQGGPSEASASSSSGQGFHQLHSPVPSGARVNAGYGMRTYKGANGKMITGMHKGIDYGVVENTKLYAVDNGTVIKTSKDPKGYGNYTVIQHPDGRQSLYGHLNRFLANPGKRVNAGDVIGLSGGRMGGPGSGNSTGPHLHFEYGSSVGTGNGQTDPRPLFGRGNIFSSLFNAVKSLFGKGPSPVGKKYGTESNINLNKKGASGDLSSGDLTSLIGSLTHGSGAINYNDLLKNLGPVAAKRASSLSVDYSKISGGGTVAHTDLMQLLYRKGFKGKALDTAYAVALAESGGRSKALGDVDLQDSKWGPSIGLFQIRSLKNWKNFDGKGSSDYYRNPSRLTDPEFNVDAAFNKSKGGTNWSPWATFTKGKFAKFLGDAAATRAALKIPGRYAGGEVKGTTPYVVGEGGPEVFVPDVNGTIIPNAKAKGMGLGGGGRSMIINVKMDVNIAQASAQEAERMVHIFANKLESKLKLHQIGVF